MYVLLLSDLGPLNECDPWLNYVHTLDRRFSLLASSHDRILEFASTITHLSPYGVIAMDPSGTASMCTFCDQGNPEHLGPSQSIPFHGYSVNVDCGPFIQCLLPPWLL